MPIRIITHPRKALYGLVFLAILAALPADAQQQRRFGQDKDGFQIWLPFEPEACRHCEGTGMDDCRTCGGGEKELPAKCGECRGKKESACGKCFGEGKYPDPFARLPCLRCDATGFVRCRLCLGKLRVQLKGGKEGAKCRICKKKGGL